MKETQILCLLLFISGLYTFTSSSPEYHFIDVFKNYTNAKSYCRELYTDLATVGNSADMARLIASVPRWLVRGWIGLEFGDGHMWHWSLPDQELDFFNWVGEPQDNNQDACVAMNPGGKWFESDCNTKRSFVCDAGGSHNRSHIFFDESKSWRQAQNHCRNISTDLVSIQSAEENQAVRSVSLSQTVWIGLFKDPWRWSDGSNSSFRFWKPNQPNYITNQLCVAAIFRDKGEWNDLKCDTVRKFVCHGALKSTPVPATTKQETTKQAAATTQIPTDLPVTPNSSTQNMETTLHKTTHAPTQQSNTDDIATEQATTSSNGLGQNVTSSFSLATGTFNTTEHGSSNSSTQVNSVTTAGVAVTEIQHSPPTSTFSPATVNTTEHGSPNSSTGVINMTTVGVTMTEMQHSPSTSGFSPATGTLNTTEHRSSNSTTEVINVTTVGVAVTEIQHSQSTTTGTDDTSGSTTLEATATYSTAASAAVTPTENSQGSTQDNLILIQENMTWMEAASYCREHHVDLVSVTTGVIQERVAKRAKNATSSHVWLGLRYTCTFNFWFWIRSDTGCYQNWAPGQGSEGTHDCGVTGAIEATGGQQWVSLPETDKLNFICFTCAEGDE